MLKSLFYTLLIIGFTAPTIQSQGISSRISEINNVNIFKTEGYFNWGSSILKDKNGKYHLFYARWEKKYSFYGWLTHSEVAHAVSDNPAGPWKYVGTALKGRGEGNWDAITAHNPKIKFFNGKYYLYYISTNLGDKKYTEENLIETSKVGYSHPNWKILRPNQRTGVAVSKSLDGPWERHDKPLIEPSGPITTLTVNPAITQGPDDKYYLIIKGDKPNETRFIRDQAIAVSDKPDGSFTIQPKPVIDDLDTEDMSIWYDKKRKKFFGIFHSNNDGKFIGCMQSRNGIEWEKAPEYRVMEKYLILNGDTLRPDRLERPFVFMENGEPSVLSLAARQGNESYGIFIPLKPKLELNDLHVQGKSMINSYKRFTEDKQGTVAFLGGSITQNGGWRDSVMVYLENKFPETNFNFIPAGISSMGSTPAAFRLYRDVISKGKIDLLFEEAAVNDDTNGRTYEEQTRAMEGIIRSLKNSNPNIDIVLMHFVDPGKMAEYNNGVVPKVIQNHHKVAAHYNVPEINLAKEVTERINAGEFDWENDFINLHPSPFGQSVYANSMTAFLYSKWNESNLKEVENFIPLPLDKNNYEGGRLVEASDKIKGNWKYEMSWKPDDGKGTRPNFTGTPFLIGTPETGVIKMKLQGKTIGIAVAAGPDAGIIEYRIDKGPWQKQDLLTKWSGGLHLPWYYTLGAGLKEGKHTLRIRVVKEKNEKSVGNYCRIRYFYDQGR